MNMLATLHRSGGVVALARQVGAPPALATAGTEALLPVVLAGLRAYAARKGGGLAGLDAVLMMLDELGDGDLAADVLGPEPVDMALGERLLDQLLAGPGRIAEIEAAAARTGLAPGMLDRMLPVLAMLVGGYISANAHSTRIGGSATSYYERIAAAFADIPGGSGLTPASGN